MINGLIQSSKTKNRNPILSFLLSSLVIGLGQMFNGDIWKGIFFLFFRIILMLLIPVTAFTNSHNSHITTFAILAFASIVLTIAAPFEALVYAIRHKPVNLNRYNNWYFYILFSFFSTFTTAFTIFIIITFYTITNVTSPESSPSLEKGEYILIRKHVTKELIKGELILYDNLKIGRIIAINKNLEYKNNALFINGAPLKYGLYSDKDMTKFSPKHFQYVLSERNNIYIYPVLVDLTVKDPETLHIENNKNGIIVANDNRLKSLNPIVINPERIIGKIEGIIFTSQLKRFLLTPGEKPK